MTEQQQGHLHLPLQRLNPVLLHLLIFNTLKRNQGGEPLCAPGKLVEQVFRQIFSGTGLMIPVLQFSAVQSINHVPDSETPWAAACQASLSITNSWSLFKLMFIELVMPSNHLILCCPLLLPSIFPGIRVFSNESVLQSIHEYWKNQSFDYTF